jgi:hypothetical protein
MYAVTAGGLCTQPVQTIRQRFTPTICIMREIESETGAAMGKNPLQKPFG